MFCQITQWLVDFSLRVAVGCGMWDMGYGLHVLIFEKKIYFPCGVL